MQNYDPFDTSSQDKAAADKKINAKLARETEEDDFKWMMSSKRGRRILWRLMEQSGVFSPSFNTNAMQMAFNEGNRNYGNRILALIHRSSSELYPQMMKENTNGGRDTDGASHNNQ